MSTIRIATADGRTAFSPGESIAVQADWQLDESPQSVEVRLVWYTRGKGDTDVCIVDRQSIEMPQSTQSWQGSFPLPRAPYSFSGKLVSLIWAVEVVVEPSGDSHRLDLVVAPQGREVEL
jgi:hypothetical protein